MQWLRRTLHTFWQTGAETKVLIVIALVIFAVLVGLLVYSTFEPNGAASEITEEG